MGGLSVASGVLLYLHTAWQFADEGNGTPVPIDEPKELVTGGIYSRVRNPMYLVVLLCIGGQALLYRSILVLWWAVGGWLIVHNRVTEYEEPHLTELYGEEYEQYCERVPHWDPRLRPADAK
jgi:protein-S-isoprenylcysteine O-methyltransferase Ste14